MYTTLQAKNAGQQTNTGGGQSVGSSLIDKFVYSFVATFNIMYIQILRRKENVEEVV